MTYGRCWTYSELTKLTNCAHHASAYARPSQGGNSIEVFVPKYHLRGRVKMVDARGNVTLPLEKDEDEVRVRGLGFGL